MEKERKGDRREEIEIESMAGRTRKMEKGRDEGRAGDIVSGKGRAREGEARKEGSDEGRRQESEGERKSE